MHFTSSVGVLRGLDHCRLFLTWKHITFWFRNQKDYFSLNVTTCKTIHKVYLGFLFCDFFESPEKVVRYFFITQIKTCCFVQSPPKKRGGSKKSIFFATGHEGQRFTWRFIKRKFDMLLVRRDVLGLTFLWNQAPGATDSVRGVINNTCKSYCGILRKK